MTSTKVAAKPPWRIRRRWMASVAVEFGLKIPPGFTVESDEPLQKTGRDLLLRIQKNLYARKLLAAKYVDGTFNSVTSRIATPPLTMADRAVKWAMDEVGEHEEPWGSNRGPRVHFYQSSTGAYNTFWCASFFWKAWQGAGYTGAVSAGAWYSTDHIGTRKTRASAKPGCGVSFNIGDGHIGMLLAFIGDQVKTVDGNTSDEVAVRLRPASEIHSISMPVMR